MTIDAAFKKIDRYLKKENIGPLVVDAQNRNDLDAIVTHYDLPQNRFIYASDSKFCKTDEFPSMAALLNFLEKGTEVYFVREISSFFHMMGEKELKQALTELLSVNSSGHVVILTYQCEVFLNTIIKGDRRMGERICIVEGEKTESCNKIILSHIKKLMGEIDLKQEVAITLNYDVKTRTDKRTDF